MSKRRHTEMFKDQVVSRSCRKWLCSGMFEAALKRYPGVLIIDRRGWSVYTIVSARITGRMSLPSTGRLKTTEQSGFFFIYLFFSLYILAKVSPLSPYSFTPPSHIPPHVLSSERIRPPLGVNKVWHTSPSGLPPG